MKVYSWNVNGLRAVIKKGTFGEFIKTHQPDILLLQETKAQPGQAEVDLPRYQEYWHSAEKKGYSGTAIFSQQEPKAIINGLPSELIDKYQLSDAYGDATNEGRVIAAEFADMFVVSVYTPNAKDDLARLPLRQQWDKAFFDYMVQLEEHKPVLFGGDLNVAHKPEDLARPKENEGKKGYTVEERQGIERYLEHGFVDTFRLFTQGSGHYSWWTHWANARARNVGWRIDYFLASASLKPKIINAQIHPEVMGSDHCPVSVELKD